MRSRVEVVALSWILVGSTACVIEGIDDQRSGFRDGEIVGGERANVPSGGGTFLGNGLEDPGVSGIDPRYGLSTPEGLSVEGLTADVEAIERTKYMVECALPAGAQIIKEVDGETLVFEGYLGLAPEWEDGACDQDCQEWVSACLMARTNVTGQSVQVWITGDHPYVGLGRDAGYPLLEATFFGNLFVHPTQQYICRGTLAGEQMAYLDGRTCTGGDPEACGFTVFDDCPLDQRCTMIGGIPTNCQAGEPAAGEGFRSLSTFVDIPDGWSGWE